MLMTDEERDLLWLLHLHEQGSEHARRRLKRAAKRFGRTQTNAANVRMCHARILYAEALRGRRAIAAEIESLRRRRAARRERRRKGRSHD